MSRAMRIAKLEPRAISQPVPHVCTVPYGSSVAAAVGAFRSLCAAKLKRPHPIIVVPERVKTADQEADFTARFYAHQTRIVAEARSTRPKGSNTV